MSIAPQSQKFGTFLGVFTPSLLTILGLIMYLRFGWVVGNVGLGLTIVIVILATSLTFITGLSVSAIATNIKVGVGGEYYLVSRSLGLEFGGAIGIPLYFCRTLSLTFYCFGLAEAMLIFWPVDWGVMPGYMLQLLTAVLILSVTLLSGKSAALTLKAQIPIMILIGLSMLALVIGVFSNGIHTPIMEPSYQSAPEGFWFVFAVFFPAVTGFSAGVGMSGDLKDPQKSIPRGTIGAILTGLLVYLIIPVLFAITGALTIDQLTDSDFGLKSWTEVAFLGSLLVIPAVWGALLSSAFGSILGGPRVLQALSMDGLAPKFLSKLNSSGQPTIATWVTGLIALLAVLIGGLNAIAQFVSMLFLTLYVTINVSAAVETLVAEPSYRPQIKVPWWISLIGALGSIGVMVLINPLAGLGSMILVGLLYVWLRSRSFEQQWGDVAAGFWINISRYALLKLKSRKVVGRNWRPFMLAFVKDIDTRLDLVKIAQYLGQNRGVLTIANLRKINEVTSLKHRKDLELEMSNKLENHGLEAFCEVHTVDDFKSGLVEIAIGHGLADLQTNTIVMGLSETADGLNTQVACLSRLAHFGHNIMLCNFNQPLPQKATSIDLWWGGQQNNGDLMLLMAFLLKLNTNWSSAKIRILSKVKDAESQEKLQRGIIKQLSISRISADVKVILSDDPFLDVLNRTSKDSDLVFLGMPDAAQVSTESIVNSITTMSAHLKATVFVQNNSMSDSIPYFTKS